MNERELNSAAQCQYPQTSISMINNLKLDLPPDQREKAWKRFVDMYCPLVYRLAKKKGLEREEAETIFQDFCCQMVRRMPSFQYNPQIGRFRDWVLTVALNLIRKHWREKAARERAHDKFRELELRGGFDEPANTRWWRQVEWTRQCQLALDQVLETASERDRELFRRIVIGGEPVDATVREYGVTANAWYGIKFRILGQLRAQANRLREEWE